MAEILFPVLLCLGAVVAAMAVYTVVAALKSRREERAERAAAQKLRAPQGSSRGKHAR